MRRNAFARCCVDWPAVLVGPILVASCGADPARDAAPAPTEGPSSISSSSIGDDGAATLVADSNDSSGGGSLDTTGAETPALDSSTGDGSSDGRAPAATIEGSHDGDVYTVTSTKAPTWSLTFAVGGGAPGGGTATALYIPADSDRSVVQSLPNQACCSGFALDNLEWRWRPFGGTNGTRAAAGLSSSIDSFEIVSESATEIVFVLQGSWTGVSQFTRTVKVTPDGYRATVDATYAGTTGMDSMWWIISMFHPDMMDGPAVTVEDADTPAVALPFSGSGIKPLPEGIALPYTVHFPLLGDAADEISLSVAHLAQDGGGARNYEFFNQGEDVAAVGPHYMFYPRWAGVFEATDYHFDYTWRFSEAR